MKNKSFVLYVPYVLYVALFVATTQWLISRS